MGLETGSGFFCSARECRSPGGDFKYSRFFDALVTPGNMPGKPDPAVFLKASRQLDIPAEVLHCYREFIPGIEAARKAGMRIIAVTTTNPPEALTQADIVIETLDQFNSSIRWNPSSDPGSAFL